jgi:transposase-like protein
MLGSLAGATVLHATKGRELYASSHGTLNPSPDSATTMSTMMTTEKQRGRREHSAEVKAQILVECDLPGASVAKVAMSHGVNANLVHGWRKFERERRQAAAAAVHAQGVVSAVMAPASPAPFLPVTIMSANDATIDLQDREGSTRLQRRGAACHPTEPDQAALG